VGLRMAADDALPAGEATRRVRVEAAARSLYRLRQALAAQGPAAADAAASRQARRALRQAHAALARAGFTDAAVAAEVLRQVQVLTMTTTLATLDYASARAAHAALATLITPATGQEELTAPQSERDRQDEQPHPSPPAASPRTSVAPTPATEDQPALVPAPVTAFSADAATACGDGAQSGDNVIVLDGQLIEAARRIAADAARDGSRLTQVALAEQLRSQGWTIANDRLRRLAVTIGLSPRRG